MSRPTPSPLAWLLLILLGVMLNQWPPSTTRSYILPTRLWDYDVADVRINWTQIIGVIFPIVLTAGTALYLRRSKVGTAMRALANDREATAMLGVPVRRVEAAAWLGSGTVCGLTAVLLGDLVGLDIVTLTFLVIPALAAALIGQLRSLWVTLVGGFVIGLPLALAGGDTPRTQSVRQFARNLLALRDMPVAFWDERLSTAAVTREMIAHDMTRKRRAEIVDRVAAAYILQGCLDAIGRSAPCP